MNKKDILESGGIEFKSSYAFPYGAEFTILKESDHPKGNWIISLATFHSKEEEIIIEGRDLFGKRFVVMSQCHRIQNHFSCLAVPIDQIENRARGIEDKIVSTLLNHINK